MNLFKLMGALKDMGKIQKEMAEAAERLSEETFEGSAGAGLVKVTANGAMKIVSCVISPEVVSQGNIDLLQELVVAAANDAVTQARDYSAQFMQKQMAERFDLPGMEGLIKGMLPK
jgi:DNA-binding YbaB/EbfC family protein